MFRENENFATMKVDTCNRTKPVNAFLILVLNRWLHENKTPLIWIQMIYE